MIAFLLCAVISGSAFARVDFAAVLKRVIGTTFSSPASSSAPALLLETRCKQTGPNISIFYKKEGGLVITEGRGTYMKDAEGNTYLDCCNNVACVGHSHPAVVKAGQDELGKIQTNSRFLHPTQQRYLTKLLATLPAELGLDTVYLVNSGSEANDLALRIAQQATTAAQRGDVICVDHAYHGHTMALLGISPYKWYQAKDGVNRQPDTTHVVPCPDTFRGKYRRSELAALAPQLSLSPAPSSAEVEEVSPPPPRQRGVLDDPPPHTHTPTHQPTQELGRLYAQHVEDIVARTGGVGTFIAESVISCGGQIVPPSGYLRRCHDAVRAAGGVCIADEVQTGFGRPGTAFWAFQQHGVRPDIVTIAKPMVRVWPAWKRPPPLASRH